MRFLIVVTIIVVAVFAAYAGVRSNAFVRYDDPLFITENPHVTAGLTVEGVRWAFTSFHSGLWHPVTWLSHMVDVELHRLNPAGHHWTNVALHAINSVLVLLALWMLCGFRLRADAFWPSAVISMLWALHPLRVESVAWAAERKDLLAAFFGLLCLIAYAAYARRPSAIRYSLVLVTLALGLMSKPMLVTWPFLLLLVDVWPLRRPAFTRIEPIEYHAAPATVARLFFEKVPLLVVCIASSVIAVIAEHAEGTVSSSEDLPLLARMTNAPVAIVRYLGKTFWPADLAVLYPHPVHWPLWVVLGSIGIILVITIVALAYRRPAPWLIIGWLWFLGTLVPVIGIVQIGAQSMADRYTYLPQLGVLIAIAFTLWTMMRERLTQMLLLVLALACGLFMQTQHQVTFWRDSRTLFERAIAVTSGNWVMHNNLGAMALEGGDVHTAVDHFTEAVRIAPDRAELHGSLGEALARLGQSQRAIEHFERAVAIDPHYSGAMNNLAWLLATLPPPLRNENRAILLAEQVCREADRTAPSYASYLDTLATTYASVGRLTDAIKAAEEARDLAARTDQPQLAMEIESRLAEYRHGASTP